MTRRGPGHHPVRRWSAPVLALALLCSVLVVGLPAAPAAAAAQLTLAKTAPSTALVGGPVSYRLTASNPGDAPLYNLTFRDVLPAGLTYRAGSVQPADAGAPAIVTTGTGCAARQTLIWSNVADLQAASTYALSFDAVPDRTCLPVAAPVTNTGEAYANTNPRVVPRFDSAGRPTTGATNTATSPPRTTTFSALQVRKREPSPEGELLRGVHDETTTYSIDVVNNEANATTGVTVTDLIPAALEYLGCGGVDYSAAVRPEYPGAPLLTATPPPAGPGVCATTAGAGTPTSPRLLGVETVTNPPPVEGVAVPPGVYTRVTWLVGDLAPGQSVTLKYRAGIPSRANAAFGPGAPSVGSTRQGANLDNNTGPSTRQVGAGATMTNTAIAAGRYTGPVQTAPGTIVDGGPTSASAAVTREIRDLRLVKQVDPGGFTQSGFANYTVTLRASEYAQTDGLVLTDVLDNGLCPLAPVGASPATPTDCLATGSGDTPQVSVDGGPPAPLAYTSYEPRDDGTFAFTLAPVRVASGSTVTITYRARMRVRYGGTDAATGGLAGEPTSAGDSFSNRVSGSGTSTPSVSGGIVTDTGPVTVTEDSSTTLTTTGLSLDKTIKPRPTGFVDEFTCDGPASDYGNAADFLADPGFDPRRLAFRKGSRVCFQILVRFSESAASRNVTLTDFLPPDTRYEPGSFTLLDADGGPPGSLGNLQPGQVRFVNEAAAEAGGADPVFELGAPTPDGARTVPRGGVFHARLAVIVTEASQSGDVDIVGNIVKLRVEDSRGRATSLRDREDFGIPAPPPIPTVKGVASVNGSPSPPAGFGSNVDDRQARQGDRVTYRLDLQNLGTVEDGNPVAARNIDLWDVLPAGITCAAVDPAGYTYDQPVTDDVRPTCYDPGSAGRPSGAPAGRSVIRWLDGSEYGSAPGPGRDRNERNALYSQAQLDSRPNPNIPDFAVQRRSYFYTLTIPTPTSVSTQLDNTAGVRQFGVLDNRLIAQPYFPADNIDSTITAEQADAPRSRDTSRVTVPNATTTKRASSAINEPGNAGAENPPRTSTQATLGEVVTYTVTVTVPAQTSVFNATLLDPLPAGQTLLAPPTATFAADGTTFGPLPAGFTVSTTGNPTLTFPATWTNSSATPHVFRMVFQVRVAAADVTNNVHGRNRSNQVQFRSRDRLDGALLPTRTDTATVRIVEPAPAIDKTSDQVDDVIGRDDVIYTLRVTNAAGRPPLHDGWVVDCVPAGMTFRAYLTSTPTTYPTLPPTPGTGTNGCPSGTTRLAWDIGSVPGGVTGAAIPTLRYIVDVDTSAVGQQRFPNTATVTGNSLDATRTDPTLPGSPDGRTYAASDSLTLVVAGAVPVKTVSNPTPTVGEVVTYTIGVTLPRRVNFYDTSLIDRVPQGVTPEATDGRPSPVVSATCQTLTTPPTPCDPPITPTELTGNPPVPDPTRAGTWGLFLGDIGPSEELRRITIVYTARVTDLPSVVAGATPTNEATVRWNLVNGPDPTTVDATWQETSLPATARVTIREPQLTLSKNVSPASADPGQVVTYALTVRNASGATVSSGHDLVVSDAVPSGVVIDPASLLATLGRGGVLSGTEPDGSGGTITWRLPGPIAPGQTLAIVYSGRLAPSATIDSAGQRNTASLASYESLPAGYGPGFPGGVLDRRTYVGNDASATLTPKFPKLEVTKAAATPGEAFIGETFRWRITVTNTGTSPAVGVDVLDLGPEHWQVVGGTATVSLPGEPVRVVEPLVESIGVRQQLSWTDLGTLGVGQSLTVTVGMSPSSSVVDVPGVGLSIPHVNEVRASASDTSGADGNLDGPYVSNEASAQAFIAAADVVLEKTAGEFVAGQTGSFTLRVRNAGPNPATGPFLVRDPRIADPAGLGAVTVTGEGWACTTGAVLVCRRADSAETLPPGSAFPPITVTYAVDSEVPAGTQYQNAAGVAARTYDPALANNTASATAEVSTSADLAITKSSSGDAVAGQDLTYTVDVTNLGPSSSRGPIEMTDTLPPGTVVRAATGDGWTCTPTSGPADSVTCRRAEALPAGSVAPQLVISVAIPSGATGEVVNRAVVTGRTPDPVPSNNTATVTDPVTTLADLALEKRHVGDFVAGTNGRYELQVVNAGPSDAAAPVRIRDTLPSGLTFQSVASTAGDWQCSRSGQDLTCTRDGAMPAGADETLTLIVRVAEDLPPGEITNSAEVDSPTPDPLPDNNRDDDRTGTDALADLSITKTVAPDPVVAGTTVTFTLSVANGGPSLARSPIVVTDALPPGVTWVDGTSSAEGTGWDCGHAARVVTCTRDADLGSGRTAPAIAVEVAVDPDAGPATLRNSASVDGPTNDPDLSNNVDAADVRVVDEAELVIRNDRVGTEPVVAGDTVDFRLEVDNLGPSDADAVSVVHTFPDGLTPLSVAGEGWDCAVSGQTVTCRRPRVPAGTTAPPIIVTARVSPSVPDGTTLVTTATTETSTPGDDPANNTDTSQVPVVARADLAITKALRTQGVILAGTDVVFDLTVRNLGLSDAQPELVVRDTLPAGFTFVAVEGAAWDCAADPPGEVVTCSLQEADGDDSAPAGLPAGATAPSLIITAAIDPGVPTGVVRNTATVTSGTVDPDERNNTATVEVPVAESADLAIEKTVAEDPVRIGEEVVWTLQVSNAGPSVARDVEVVDRLPVGVTFVSATGEGWSCAADGDPVGEVRCVLDEPLPPGGSEPRLAPPITLVATVTPGAYPTVTNPAEVSSSTPDPDLANNSARSEVGVLALVDLSITKRHTGTPQVGGQVRYTLVVRNDGPTEDPGPVRVVDPLPSGLAGVSADGDGWDCTVAARDVTCVRSGALAVDATAELVVIADVLPAAAPRVTNVTTVSSPAEDVDLTNNEASDVTPVLPLVQLEIVKELVRFDVAAAEATYRLTVTNAGPNATIDPVLVTDDLAPQLRLVSARGDGFSCLTQPGFVRCEHPSSLAVGSSASVQVVASVTADPGTRVVNIAQTIGGGPGPDGEDARDTSDEVVLEVPRGDETPPTGAALAGVVLLALLLLGLGVGLVRAASAGPRRSR
jgi:uncharacterized repeat protein (TIGR01451 family)/fimbrial isopeptide formation D2 family protein